MTEFLDQSNQILERIAAIQQTIALPDGVSYVTTIGSADPYLPTTISSAKCPFFVNEILGGDTRFQATGALQFVETAINMVLCVLRREQNTDLRLGYKQTLYWRNAVFAAFVAHVQLGQSSQFPRLFFVQDAMITRWQPPGAPYPIGGAEYLALQFNLLVRESFSLAVGQ